MIIIICAIVSEYKKKYYIQHITITKTPKFMLKNININNYWIKLIIKMLKLKKFQFVYKYNHMSFILLIKYFKEDINSYK